MAQYWLDLTRSSATVLAEFASLGASDTFSLVNDGGTTTALYFYANGIGAKIWTPPGTSVEKMQILVRMRTTGTESNNFHRGIGGRLYNSSGSIAGYSCTSVDASARTRIHRLPEKTTLTDFDVTADSSVYRWTLFDLDGTTVRFKNWVGHVVDDRPASWQASVTDATHTAGGAGLFARDRSANRDLYVSVLSVGTGGDPAPSGPVSARRRSPLLLTPW